VKPDLARRAEMPRAAVLFFLLASCGTSATLTDAEEDSLLLGRFARHLPTGWKPAGLERDESHGRPGISLRASNPAFTVYSEKLQGQYSPRIWLYYRPQSAGRVTEPEGSFFASKVGTWSEYDVYLMFPHGVGEETRHALLKGMGISRNAEERTQ
jgi:hypothetical protein